MAQRPTADDVEAELAVRRMPGGERSWLDVVADAARAEGALLAEVCDPARRSAIVVRARRRAFAQLHRAGYSSTEIAAVWGMHHTVVLIAIHIVREAA